VDPGRGIFRRTWPSPRWPRTSFLKVLEKDDKNTTALASLASLSYNQASSLTGEKKVEKFDEAAKWYKKLIDVDPKNKEAFLQSRGHRLGEMVSRVDDRPRRTADEAGDPGPVKDKKVKEELKEKYSAMVDDGIANLQKALDLDKEYDDAMAYMNLLIRERADLVDNPDEYKKADRRGRFVGPESVGIPRS